MNRAMLCVLMCAGLILSAGTWSSSSGQVSPPLAQKEFFKSDLAMSMAAVELDAVIAQLPNQTSWTDFRSRQQAGMVAYIDPRSGKPASIVLSVPLIPGSGSDNLLTLTDLGQRLGRPVQEVTSSEVAEAVKQYILSVRDVVAVAGDQFGPVQAGKATADIWQISIPQQVNGVPVRHGRLVATINSGNLILLGTTVWGDVRISTVPSVSQTEAETKGFAYVGGRQPGDTFWRTPSLEIIPYAPPEWEAAFAPVGQGYGHRLAWVFGLERSSEAGRWEVMVDAHTGEIIAFQDRNQRLRKITGGVYPATATEVCPTPPQCGVMQPDYPMPWTDTNLPAPNNFTNGAGVFDAFGTARTLLQGKYAEIGAVGCVLPEEMTSTGDLNLAGSNADHECTWNGIDPICSSSVDPCGTLDLRCDSGPLAGVCCTTNSECKDRRASSAAARTAYYEVNKIAEIGRGWLPGNKWLNGLDSTNNPDPVRINAGFGMICLPVWVFGSNRMDLSPAGNWEQCSGVMRACRGPGELASAVDHEWGHGMDDNDVIGAISNTSEAYADIAAIYRQQWSCIGHGAFIDDPLNETIFCDKPLDGIGFNVNMAGCGKEPHCTTNCSGARDADYAKHLHLLDGIPVDGIPDTAQNFVCNSCTSGTGPCGGTGTGSGEVHCVGAPVAQAAWDLATRDLTWPPFNYDSATAFIIANKLFYQGSGNIDIWYECDCSAGTSSGCGAGSGYMQWLTADDDNGNLLDGTPHMTALYNAFHRHEIACSPHAVASADHVTTKGRVVPPTSYSDTRTSNDVREVLEEGLDAGASRLEHEWRFDNVLTDVPRNLLREGYRPLNAEGDNFKFYWSNDRASWTEIAGAEIKKAFELQGGEVFPFGGPFSPTVYVKVQDTQMTGSVLDRVNVDLLAIGNKLSAVQNSGCSAGPTAAPVLTVASAGPNCASLTWTPVTGAVRYWVFRGEGHAPCDTARALIAQPTAASYIDGELAPGRQYCFSVTAAGGSGSESSRCFGPTSVCQCVTVGTCDGECAC